MSGGGASVARDRVRSRLSDKPLRWLVTGSAGFIGSHLVESLLNAGQEVVGLDNFATGHRSNLDEVRRAVGDSRWKQHSFIEGDIADWQACVSACQDRSRARSPIRVRRTRRMQLASSTC
jgi:UDP-N-acetylglucosamine 4-epimerase